MLFSVHGKVCIFMLLLVRVDSSESRKTKQQRMKSLLPIDVTETYFFYMLVDLEGLGSVQRVDEHEE